jgi:antitoxin component YwqK of YwqJK toxin-antitoxin module
MKSLRLLVVLSLVLLISCNREKNVTEKVSYPDGTPKSITEYKVTGKRKEIQKETNYYPGNKLQVTGTYKEGKRDGHWIYYYRNGKIWSEGFFKDGKNEGKRVTYFENGQVRYEAYYKDDLRVGKWRFFDEQGTLLQVIKYDNPSDTLTK